MKDRMNGCDICILQYLHPQNIIQALQHRIQLESEVSTARNENSSKKHYDVMNLAKQQRQHIAEFSACL